MPADIIPETHRDLLDATSFAHLASIGPDGEPQSHPVWYGFEDGRLMISTTTDRQKYRNVRREPRVSASILDPDDPYRYLEIRGRVVETREDPEKKYIDHLAEKYLGDDEYPNKRDQLDRVTLVIEPEHAATMG